MDDQAYADRLFAILTNPTPTGIDPSDPYGQADDGIDRYDGFGREVWVESITLAEGEHGTELEIWFALDLSPESREFGVPARGVRRLPVDAEWRQLSGYADPAAYAPAVAREVWFAAGSHVYRHHRQGSGSRKAEDPVTVVADDADELWQDLLDALRLEGAVREVGPGRLEVASDEMTVTVLVTPDQWVEVVAAYVDDLGLYVSELLGSRDDDERFVVFWDGRLTGSTREKLPPVRGRALERTMARLRAEHGDGQLHWRA